jgi:hypothetical protein
MNPKLSVVRKAINEKNCYVCGVEIKGGVRDFCCHMPSKTWKEWWRRLFKKEEHSVCKKCFNDIHDYWMV